MIKTEVSKVGHSYIHQRPVEGKSLRQERLSNQKRHYKRWWVSYRIYFFPLWYFQVASMMPTELHLTPLHPSLSLSFSSTVIFLTYLWFPSVILLPDTCFEFSSLSLNTYLSCYLYQIKILLGFTFFPWKEFINRGSVFSLFPLTTCPIQNKILFTKKKGLE